MMRATAKWGRFGTATCGVVAAVLCAGCGTAAYEAKLEAAIKQLKLDNQFVGLDPSETLVAAIKNEQGVGAKISLRKPSRFDGQAYAEGAADPRDPSKPLPPERVKPAVLMNFPGFRFSYESVNTAPNRGQYLTNVYCGAQPVEAGVAERIAGDLQAAFPDSDPLAWSNTPVLTPAGGTITWRTLSLTQPQTFIRPNDGSTVEVTGLFQVWMYEQQGFQAFVALRTSATNQELDELRQSIVAALGTIRVVTPTKIE